MKNIISHMSVITIIRPYTKNENWLTGLPCAHEYKKWETTLYSTERLCALLSSEKMSMKTINPIAARMIVDEEGGMKNNEVGNCGRSRCNCLNGTGEPCNNNSAEVESIDGDSNSGLTEDDFNEFFSEDLKEILEGMFSSCINNPVQFMLHKEVVRALEINQNEVENPNANKHEVIDQRRVLSNVYVGKAERLKQVIKIMCDSKKSLEKMGMHLPPWRKYRYMRFKYLF
jgi:hypothetical protein